MIGFASPFRRNDEIVTDGLDALVVFPGNGITENLMQKSAAAGVPVWERGRDDVVSDGLP